MTNARLQAMRLADLLRREQADMADFLVALAEFDRGKGWLDLGYASLFYFLHRELGLSKGSAYHRKVAAELVQKFPEIVAPLRDGRLCITSIVQVSKVLTVENWRDVLPMFFHRSKRDAMTVAAALQPTSAPHRDVVTTPRLPETEPGRSVSAALVQPVEPTAARSAAKTTGAASPPPPPRGNAATRDSADPLNADLSRLHVTVSKRFLDKLEAARAALSHSDPDANMAAVLEAGLDLLLRRHAARKGVTDTPRKDLSSRADGLADSSGIPAAVKRRVWARDGGRCRWPLEGGGVCGSALRVEFDHVIPRAMGGPPTVENIRLLCRFHNDLAARQSFGDAWMNRFTRSNQASASAPTASD